jgi:hypothetical protein
MFRHHNVARYDEAVSRAHAFDRRLEQRSGFRFFQIRQTAIAAEGEEMHRAAARIADESERH